MMIVIAPNAVHMHRNASSLRERLQTMRQHLAAQVADLFSLRAQVDDGEGSVREVDDGAGEGFVEWAVSVAETSKAGRGLESGFEGLAMLSAPRFPPIKVTISHTCPSAMQLSSAVWWSSICKSPLVLNCRLHPPCFASACNM